MMLVPLVRRSESPARLSPQTTRFFDLFNDFPLSAPLLRTPDVWMPAVDILEKDGTLLLRAELPGVNEKEIDLKLEGNLLTLRGEKKIEKSEDNDNYHRIESYQGSFSRSFKLPETVDRDKIKAESRTAF